MITSLPSIPIAGMSEASTNCIADLMSAGVSGLFCMSSSIASLG